MGNRMLRDWTMSEKIDKVSVHAERFFTRLIMKVDDYGCFHADTRLLKANLFPLKLESVREADLLRWMTECQKAGLIVLYESSSKRYLQILDFRQRLDKAKAKYPLPSVSDFPEIVNDFPAEEEPELELELELENEKKGSVFKEKNFSIAFPWPDEIFLEQWQHWKNYKLKEHRFKYKSPTSEQAALNGLANLSGGKLETAIKIIHQSLANGWKGFFPLKNDAYGNTNSKTTKQPTGAGVDTAAAFAAIDSRFSQT